MFRKLLRFATLPVVGVSLGASLLKMKNNKKIFSKTSEENTETLPPLDEESRNLLENALEKYKKFPKGKWTLVSKKDGCKVHSLTDDKSSFRILRGVVILDSCDKSSPKELIDFISDYTVLDERKGAQMKKMHPDCIYYNVVDKKGGKRYVCHFRYTANNWLVSDRDFLVIRTTKHESPDKSYILGASYLDNLKRFPIDKECVRATTSVNLFTATKLDDGKIELEYIIHTDPGGYIPAFIYNQIAYTNAFCCSRYARAFTEEKNKQDNL